MITNCDLTTIKTNDGDSLISGGMMDVKSTTLITNLVSKGSQYVNLLTSSTCVICAFNPYKCQPQIYVTMIHGSNWWDVKDDTSKIHCHGMLTDILMIGNCTTTTSYNMTGKYFSDVDWHLYGSDKSNQMLMTCDPKT